jgi:hypothetical protein
MVETGFGWPAGVFGNDSRRESTKKGQLSIYQSGQNLREAHTEVMEYAQAPSSQIV